MILKASGICAGSLLVGALVWLQLHAGVVQKRLHGLLEPAHAVPGFDHVVAAPRILPARVKLAYSASEAASRDIRWFAPVT
jgi:hypothetical protein